MIKKLISWLARKREPWPCDEDRTLGYYNAEVSRGIVHTKKWEQKMRIQQEEFNICMIAEYKRRGYHLNKRGNIYGEQGNQK